jgi:hypothetical protein
MKYSVLRLFLLACGSLLLLAGCATHIKVDATQNPPPDQPFSAFAHYEIKPVSLPPLLAGQAANQKALRKIQELSDADTNSLFIRWSQIELEGRTDHTLLIEPRITEIKFINATSRVWAGPMAGSSAIVLTVTFTDKETGKVIAQPVFYSRAEAWSGTFTVGVADNMMLSRVVQRFYDYLQLNFNHAVGGPTGANPGK